MSYRKSCLSKSCAAQPPAQPPSKALWHPKRMQKNTDSLINVVLGAHNQLAQNHLALPRRPPELLEIPRLPSMCMRWAALAASESLKIHAFPCMSIVWAMG